VTDRYLCEQHGAPPAAQSAIDTLEVFHVTQVKLRRGLVTMVEDLVERCRRVLNHGKFPWYIVISVISSPALRRIGVISQDLVDRHAECPVCKDGLCQGEETRRMPCEHVFHPACLVTWLKQVHRMRY
jgi:hypothetical protein